MTTYQASHWRSLSLNDLESLSKSIDNNCFSFAHNQASSSSSSEILSSIRGGIVYPCQPKHPPPYRVGTPPGVPKFGTTEALQLRLLPSEPYSRTSALINRVFVGRNDYSEERLPSASHSSLHSIASSRGTGSPSISAHRQASPPMDMLKRILGGNRAVETTTLSRDGSLLPPWIAVAKAPGSLAIAEDGTLVRGRWGTRHSSHGIGTRGLEAHPLFRTTNHPTSLEELVDEIDKACEAADRHRAESGIGSPVVSPELRSTSLQTGQASTQDQSPLPRPASITWSLPDSNRGEEHRQMRYIDSELDRYPINQDQSRGQASSVQRRDEHHKQRKGWWEEWPWPRPWADDGCCCCFIPKAVS